MAQLRLLLPGLALLLAGCSQIWLPESIEDRVGELASQSIRLEMPPIADPAWQKYIEDIGGKIAAVSERPDYHYRYYIVESSTVNAFAVPDGSIFVTTELLKLAGRNQLALAAILAHEIGHIARRHGAETLQLQLGYGVMNFFIFGFERSAARQAGDLTSKIVGLGYGREMELEADICAVRYLARLGYQPEGSLEFLRILLPLGKGRGDFMLGKYLRTHPPTEERISYVENYLQQHLTTQAR
ncbi:MAG: M48 family metalloprotease [Elusimicrobiota bacterium]